MMALVVLAFFIKAIIPSGFMISTSPDQLLTVTICSQSALSMKSVEMVVPGDDGSDSHRSDQVGKDSHCAFAGLAKTAIAAADTVLLAIAFAYLLVLGLAPTRRLALRRIAHVRPPLRGPPAAA